MYLETWKKPKTRYANLRKLGIDKQKSYEYSQTRKGYWRISKSPILNKSITNQYLEKLGYKNMSKKYQLIHSI